MNTEAVEIDTEKVDEAVLALLYLGKAKSVMFTDKGLAASERAFAKLFSRRSGKA